MSGKFGHNRRVLSTCWEIDQVKKQSPEISDDALRGCFLEYEENQMKLYFNSPDSIKIIHGNFPNHLSNIENSKIWWEAAHVDSPVVEEAKKLDEEKGDDKKECIRERVKRMKKELALTGQLSRPEA